jgi:predicted lipoprotein with Yx(FWY)xxD motif
LSRRIGTIALLAFAAALPLGGCGGGSSRATTTSGNTGGSVTTAPPVPPNPDSNSSAFVSLASVPALGLVLSNSEGLVLYGFEADSGTRSACDGRCAQVWPPLLTEGPPQPSNGASASKLGTIKRGDGKVQVTYAGHPLYTYAADKKPGEDNGNGLDSFGAGWFALKGNGRPAG